MEINLDMRILLAIKAHKEALSSFDAMHLEILAVAKAMKDCIERGNKILLMGNGGSAADCQHIAAEIVGRFKKERPPWPAISLTTDTSAITAIGNDFGYEEIFSRQIFALCNPGDIVIGITTSGNSKNIVLGFAAAKNINAIIVLLSGGTGGLLRDQCDHQLIVESESTARIQEMHILIGHILCEILEETCTGKPK